MVKRYCTIKTTKKLSSAIQTDMRTCSFNHGNYTESRLARSYKQSYIIDLVEDKMLMPSAKPKKASSKLKVAFLPSKYTSKLIKKSLRKDYPIVARVIGLYKKYYRYLRRKHKKHYVTKGRIVAVGPSIGVITYQMLGMPDTRYTFKQYKKVRLQIVGKLCIVRLVSRTKRNIYLYKLVGPMKSSGIGSLRMTLNSRSHKKSNSPKMIVNPSLPNSIRKHSFKHMSKDEDMLVKEEGLA